MSVSNQGVLPPGSTAQLPPNTTLTFTAANNAGAAVPVANLTATGVIAYSDGNTVTRTARGHYSQIINTTPPPDAVSITNQGPDALSYHAH